MSHGQVWVENLNHPLIFHESFQCSRIACPVITRLSSPSGTTRTACRCSDVASPWTTRGVSENPSLPARSNVPGTNEGSHEVENGCSRLLALTHLRDVNSADRG